MFSTSKSKEPITDDSTNQKMIDAYTIWLIRIACLLIIVFFSGILFGIPILISFGKSQLNNSLLNFKEAIKTLLDIL
tara:strand:- start:14769 stop:14999 length:231 start_codon:yes stop_codon:yes gene_type:complete